MAQPLRRALTAHLESSDDEDEANNGLQRTSSDVSDVKTHGSNRASLLTKQLRDAASLPLASVSEAHADRGLAGDTADSQRHDVQLRSSNVTTGGPSPIHLHPRATLDPAALLAARSSTGTITTAAPSLTGETGSCASRGVDIVPPKRGALTGARDRSGPLALAPFGPGEGWEAEAAHRKCSSLPEHSNTKGLPDYLSHGKALSNPQHAAATSLSSASRSAPAGTTAAAAAVACGTNGDARGTTLTLPGLPLPLPDRTANAVRGPGSVAAGPGAVVAAAVQSPPAQSLAAAVGPGTSLSLSLSRGGSLSASGSLQQLAGPSLETLLQQVLASASLLSSMDLVQPQQQLLQAATAASLARLCSVDEDADAQMPVGATAPQAASVTVGAAAGSSGSRRPMRTATHSQPGTGGRVPHGNHMASLAGLLSSAAAGASANGHAADAAAVAEAERCSRGASASGPHPLMHSPWSWSGGERLDLLAAAAATVAAAGGEAGSSYDPVPLVAAVADPVAAVDEFERQGLMEGTVRRGWPRKAMSLPLGGLLLTAAAPPSPGAASVGASGPPSFDASSTDMAMSMGGSVSGSLGALSRAVSGALPLSASRFMYGSGGSGSGAGEGGGFAGVGGSRHGGWPLSPPRMTLPPLLQRRSGVAC